MNSRISFDLSGTTSIITGGSSGIGLATAQLIAKSGGNVIITNSRSEEKTKKAIDLIKSSSTKDNLVLSFPYIAENEESVKLFFDEVKKVSSRFDYLVHAIGISPDTPFDEQTAELWNNVFATNVTGTFLALKNAKNLMSNQDLIDEVRGKIVLITSTNGIDSYGIFSAPYDASKAAMINMVRNIGEDFHKNHQILINGIGPGWIATDMNKSVPEDEMKKELEKVWSARMAKPEEIAQNILALLTLPYNSGRDHMVDGGYR
ncbi:MAG: SDR family NAD(P)-dependent oxidoreductase [Candidatus Gracilibacteria bacterium]|nr:SDR family NAD(P)-dependent oxidoreductase [Candidatus Gracilibacteria bacterium]